MSLQNAIDFARKVSSNAALGVRVTAALKENAAVAAATAFAAFGREQGFDFTPEEAIEARHQVQQSQTMSEGDLEKVAGGSTINYQFGDVDAHGALIRTQGEQ